MEGIAVTITDSGTPRSQFVELDSEHRLWVNSVVILYPLQSLSCGVRIVFNSTSVCVSPQISIVGNEFVARVINAIVNITYNILLGECCSVGKFHAGKRTIVTTRQSSNVSAVAIEASVEQPYTCEHCLCGVFVDVSIGEFLSGHVLSSIAQVSQNLCPKSSHVTLCVVVARLNVQRHVAIL